MGGGYGNNRMGDDVFLSKLIFFAVICYKTGQRNLYERTILQLMLSERDGEKQERKEFVLYRGVVPSLKVRHRLRDKIEILLYPHISRIVLNILSRFFLGNHESNQHVPPFR